MKRIINTAQGQSSKGFTLVELMVAMVIGLLMMGGVIQVFTSNKQTHRLQEAMARVQENGRIAIQIMSQDIRMADFWGCTTSSTDIFNNLDPDDPRNTTDIDLNDGGIGGTDGATDTITLQGAFGGSMYITPPFMLNTAADISVSPDATMIKEDDIILISDCNSGDIFEVTSVDTNSAVQTNVVHNGAGININQRLSRTYIGDASIYVMRRITYAVTDNELTLSDNGGVAQTLVDGVDNLQILYGEDTDGDLVPNRYVDATLVGDWAEILTVRITLTMRSEDNIASSEDNIASKEDADNGDRRIRRIFTTTVSIRNRLG